MWSFKEEDPPNGADGQFERHDFEGSRSLNLLGGLIDPPADPPGTESFAIEVTNVSLYAAIDIVAAIYRAFKKNWTMFY